MYMVFIGTFTTTQGLAGFLCNHQCLAKYCKLSSSCVVYSNFDSAPCLLYLQRKKLNICYPKFVSNCTPQHLVPSFTSLRIH